MDMSDTHSYKAHKNKSYRMVTHNPNQYENMHGHDNTT